MEKIFGKIWKIKMGRHGKFKWENVEKKNRKIWKRYLGRYGK